MGTRAKQGKNCPYCAGQKAIPGETDLATLAPPLYAQWDWTENQELSPHHLTPGSNQKVWWECPEGHKRHHSPNQIWDSKRKTVRTCSQCRTRRDSHGATELKQWLEQLGYKPEPEKQGLFTNKAKRVDLYLPQQALAIEYNGEYWHSDEIITPKYGISSKEFHETRKTELNQKGTKLCYVWASDWQNNQANTKEALLKALNNEPIPLLLQRTESNRTYTPKETQQLKAKYNKNRKPKSTPTWQHQCKTNHQQILNAAKDPTQSIIETATHLQITKTQLQKYLKEEKINWTRKRTHRTPTDPKLLQQLAQDPIISQKEALKTIRIKNSRTLKSLLRHHNLTWTKSTHNHKLANHKETILTWAADPNISQKEAAQRLNTTEASLRTYCSNHKIRWTRTR